MSFIPNISILSKPDKIWLHNTNLYYAISGANPETGSLRETFMLQHLTIKHKLTLPVKGDFLVDGTWTFEVGGKSKTSAQIQGVPNAFLAKDGI